MVSIPQELMYTREHEWARNEGEVVRVGITHHAQEKLGDVVYVELPLVGARVSTGEAFGVVESVKAVSDLFAPISGEVAEANGELGARPELVNADPYGDGWMISIRPSAPEELDSLLTAAEYEALTSAPG